MSDTENTSVDTVIEKIELSEGYKDAALEQVRSLVLGNQFNPDDVVIESFDGEVLNFQAETMLYVFTKDFDKYVPGQLKGPLLVKDENAARDEMTKAYQFIANDVALERQIRDVFLKRDDKGFALDKHQEPLHFIKKQFVVYEPCQTCQATGRVTCQPCSGKGAMPCPRCHGAGVDNCHHCHGAQMVQGQNGQRIACPVCHGRGKTMCSQCQQKGTIQCRTCSARGSTKCPNCEGHAWVSHLFTQEYYVRTEFDYPRKRLPEKVVALIERYGVKIRDHANIMVTQEQQSAVNVDDAQKQKHLESIKSRKDICFPIIFTVALPYGHFEYGINGKSYYTFLFGTHGRFTHVSPFIDDLIKDGVRKLTDAAQMRGQVADNLMAAVQYRTVKEALLYSARYGTRRARKALKKSNPIGLSSQMIDKLLKLSDIAMKNLTKRSRYIGLGASSVFQLGFFGAYFLTPFRNFLIGHVSGSHMHMAVDFIIGAAVLFIGINIVQIVAQKISQKDFERIFLDDLQQRLIPKLGEVSYYNFVLGVLLFFGFLEGMRSFGIASVGWYSDVIQRFIVLLS